MWYPAFCSPMVCSPPSSSVHGISQARILECVAIPFSRGSPRPRDGIRVSCCLLHWQAGLVTSSKRASRVAQRLKRLPAMRETWFDPWVRKILLEKEMAPHSRILACRNPGTEEPGGLQSTGSQRVGHDLRFVSVSGDTCCFCCCC